MKCFFLKYDSNLIDLLRYALLRVETLDNIGLFNGRLGTAIIFYEYSRYSKNKLYEEYASEIIDSISEIPNNLSLSLSDGLLGIGWGMSYLFFKQYIGGDIEYVLSDLDRKIISNLKSNSICVEDYFLYMKMKNSYLQNKPCDCENILNKIWHTCLII